MNYQNNKSYPKVGKAPKAPKRPLRRTKLRISGVSDVSTQKKQIQALLREVGLLRDKGCIFRNYPETGKCGGYRKDGELIVQFDHLNSRVHGVSFADSRLGVIACLRHHFYYKKQYPTEYERCVIDNIGKKRAELLYRVRADKSPHKLDLKLSIIVLEQELATLKESIINGERVMVKVYE